MVHDAARTGFAREADAYERARPDYATEAVDWLLERVEGSHLVDVAAGTGKFTRQLRGWEGRVTAVEPVLAMRSELARVVAFASAVGGTAEALPLRAGCADVITAAQAFHWFDGDAALGEFRRALRDGGALAVVFNTRDMTDELNVAISEIVEPHRGDAPSQRTGRWREPLERTSDFENAGDASFANDQSLDEDGLVDRVGSTSVIGALPPGARADVDRRVRALARSRGGSVTMRYRTEVFLFRAR